MRLQIVSDLHLECHVLRDEPSFTGINAAHDADLLVLAGDIGAGIDGIARFKNWPVPVLYVHGNHELYGGDHDQVEAKIRETCADTRIFFMERDQIIANTLGDFPPVRFFGTTLWTDYRLFGDDQQEAAMARCADRMKCHHSIRYGNHVFTPSDALALHQTSRAWLQDQLATPFDGKTVVITHHGVGMQSVAERYRNNLVTAGFSSDMGDLVAKADLWIHGHTHDSFDYQVGKCRVVVNPRGYPMRHASDGIYENAGFNSQMVVSL